MLVHKHFTVVSWSSLSSIRKLLCTQAVSKRKTQDNSKETQVSKTRVNDNEKNPKEFANRLAKLLDTNEDEATTMVRTVPRLLKHEDRIVPMVETLKKYGMLDAVKTKYPHLLLFGHVAFENYLVILRETGMNIPPDKPNLAARYPTYKLKTMQAMKRNYLSPDFDVIQNYIKVLDFDENSACGLYKCLPANIDLLSLETLRKKVIAYYLKNTWKYSVANINSIMSENIIIQNRSLAWTKQTTEILQNYFPIKSKKLLSYSNLLVCHPEKLLELTKKVKTLGNVPLADLVNKNPLILRKSPEQLLDTDTIFTKSGYPSRSLKNFPAIYFLSNTTVAKRFQEMQTHADTQHLKHHFRFSKVVYYQNTVKKRIKSLNEGNRLRTNVTLNRLCSDSKHYNDAFSEVSHLAKGNDIVGILLRFFPGKTVSEIRSRLSCNAHWRMVSVTSVAEVLKHIQSLGIHSNECLFNALTLVLYPLQSVCDSFKTTIDSGEAKPEDPYFLSMALYFLEKGYYFSGDGVWNFESNDTSQQTADDDFELEKMNMKEGDDEVIDDEVDEEEAEEENNYYDDDHYSETGTTSKIFKLK